MAKRNRDVPTGVRFLGGLYIPDELEPVDYYKTSEASGKRHNHNVKVVNGYTYAYNVDHKWYTVVVLWQTENSVYIDMRIGVMMWVHRRFIHDLGKNIDGIESTTRNIAAIKIDD